ncbi:MAG: toll/interleukin-1 receptor domain-containing protein [Anaerolineaceae bacterium]|nr:toll/interleukin-1 receptor domain-containing protein [Anaerolineaceae bacterium]
MDYDAFISYAHTDGLDAAQSLKTSLKRAYFDQHGNRAAGEWEKKIRGAIQESAVFCFLITPASITSDYCQQEWMWAREAEKPIIPVIVKNVDKTKIAEKYHDFYKAVHAVQYIPPDEAPAWQRYYLHLRTVYREFDRAIHFATEKVTFIDITGEVKEKYIQPEADAIFIRMVETPGKTKPARWKTPGRSTRGVSCCWATRRGQTTMLLHAQNLIAAYVRDPNQRMPFYTSIAQWDPTPISPYRSGSPRNTNSTSHHALHRTWRGCPDSGRPG